MTSATDLADEIAEAISDTLDMDWSPSWAAPNIIAIINRERRLAREEGAKAMQDAAASYIDGRKGVIPGATVFVPLIIGHNQPCMSGDMRDRLNPHKRRQFDDAARDLANAIAALDPAQIAGGGK